MSVLKNWSVREQVIDEWLVPPVGQHWNYSFLKKQNSPSILSMQREPLTLAVHQQPDSIWICV